MGLNNNETTNKTASMNGATLPFFLCTSLILTFFTIVSFFLLSSSFSFAAPIEVVGNNGNAAASVNAAVFVPAACTLSTTSGSGETYHVSMYNGQYKNNIGDTTITASCNVQNGYNIYAAGYSDDTYGNTVMISSNTGGSNIVTGTATTGDTSNWAMKLAAVTSSGYTPVIENGFDSFSSVPSASTKVASVTSSTATLVSAASVKATYAVYISPTQEPASYTGKVRYTLVYPTSNVPNEPHDCDAGKICYWPNGGDMSSGTTVGVPDTMGDQSVDGATSVNVWPTNFQRKGYGFAGWSTTYDYDENNPDTKFYGPRQTITLPDDISEKGLSLYAIWVKSTGYLQNWQGCSSLDIAAYDSESGSLVAGLSSVTALTDKRDGDTYAVARLADGQCWMIENLRLDNTVEITMEDTDNPSLPLINDGYAGTKSNYLAAKTLPWCAGDSVACINQTNIYTNNTVNPVAMMTDGATQPVYSYGNYYNWYAATAGHGTLGFNVQNRSVDGSICPAGWRLPASGDNNYASSNDLTKLGVAITGNLPEAATISGTPGYRYVGAEISNIFRSFPNNFMKSGFISDAGKIGGYDGNMMLNSSTTYIEARRQVFNPAQGSTVVTSQNWNKRAGSVVRCISRTQN